MRPCPPRDGSGLHTLRHAKHRRRRSELRRRGHRARGRIRPVLLFRRNGMGRLLGFEPERRPAHGRADYRGNYAAGEKGVGAQPSGVYSLLVSLPVAQPCSTTGSSSSSDENDQQNNQQNNQGGQDNQGQNNPTGQNQTKLPATPSGSMQSNSSGQNKSKSPGGSR